ncbi:MAG: hypothetical protein V6Z86_09750 [Hyphomicrobiales bacterium]
MHGFEFDIFELDLRLRLRGDRGQFMSLVTLVLRMAHELGRKRGGEAESRTKQEQPL